MRKAKSIEEVKKYILCDDLVASGKDISSLVEFTDVVDSNTTVELLDYGQAIILHHVGDQGRFLSYMPLKVGDEDIFSAKAVKDSSGKSTIRMIGPKCKLIDYVDVIQSENGSGEGLLSEVMDPYDSTGGKVPSKIQIYQYASRSWIPSDIVPDANAGSARNQQARCRYNTYWVLYSNERTWEIPETNRHIYEKRLPYPIFKGC